MAGYTGREMFKHIQDLTTEVAQLKRELAREKAAHKSVVLELKNIVQCQAERIVLLENENDRLRKIINGDSGNSSKPPSCDIKPNIPNNREKSGRTPGGQKGREPKFLCKKDVEAKIASGEYAHEIVEVGEKSAEYKSKYILDIKLSVVAKEYRFYEGAKIPKAFATDVQYGDEIRTFCTVLSTEGGVAIDRLANFVKAATVGVLSVSHGSIVNFLSKASANSADRLQAIEDALLNSPLMHTDATVARVGNRNISVRNYSTKKLTLLKATRTKSRKSLEETGILPKFTGDLVHDHETVMYRYGRNHGECNVHVLRYLKRNLQTTQNSWAKDLRAFLCCLNEHVKWLKNSGTTEISDEKFERLRQRYDEILATGVEQNKRVKSKVYREDERRLLRRLEKYRENHLLFLRDFNVPFDNNLSERDLRHVKTKQKISGCWRSMVGAQNYLNVKSVIETCKKNGEDFFVVIKNLFKKDSEPCTDP